MLPLPAPERAGDKVGARETDGTDEDERDPEAQAVPLDDEAAVAPPAAATRRARSFPHHRPPGGRRIRAGDDDDFWGHRAGDEARGGEGRGGLKRVLCACQVVLVLAQYTIVYRRTQFNPK